MLKENTFVKTKFKKLFICAILGWLVELLGSMADSVIAGIYLDSDAVAAVSLVTPILSICYFFVMLFGQGAAIRYSQTMGAFKVDLSKKIAGMAMFIAFALTGLTLFILLAFKDTIIGFYGVTGDILRLTEEYYTPLAVVAACYPIQYTVYYLVYQDGDEKIILLSDIVTAVSNSVFSLLLVQRIGIAGLGYGTVISCVLGFLCTLPHFLKKNNSIGFKPYFSGKELFSIVKAGSAFSMITLYIGIIDLVFNKFIIVTFSEAYLAAYAVINIVMNFAAALNCAVNGGSIFITVAYGEDNPQAIRRAMGLTNRYTLIIGLALTALMELLAPYWAELYSITDPAVYAVSVYAGRVIPLFFLAAAFTYTYFGYYPLVDKPIEGNILVMCYMLIGPIVLAMPMAHIGFNAMSWGFALTPVFALAVTFLYILFTKQLKNAPYLLKKSEEREAHFDFELTEPAILEGRERIAAFLRAEGVKSSVVNRCQMVFEDAMGIIRSKNTKKVICECTVLVSDARIRLITKDNGVIFDLVQEADSSHDLQSYVLARMQADAKEATYSVTTSFNRNVCVWEL